MSPLTERTVIAKRGDFKCVWVAPEAFGAIVHLSFDDGQMIAVNAKGETEIVHLKRLDA
jgi:hypothetical protein